MTSRIIAKFSPARTFLYSIIILIAVGTALLALPGTSNTPLSMTDLIFTATSAITATGIFPIKFTQFTLFGHAIILLLIQMGSLGIITLGLFFVSLFVDLGFTNSLMAGQLMNVSRWHHVKKILFFVVSLTFISELVGTFYFTYILSNTKPLGEAIYTGAFQAISSFCNAGPTLLPAETVDTPAIIIPTSFLVYLGGFGFIPLYELTQYVWHKIQKKRYIISLYTRVIIRTSTTLLLGSTILFWIIEKNNILINMPIPAQFIEALLYSINFKSAGFLVPNPTHLQYQTILLMLCIAFIGSSPGSMGSGIKISTFAVIIAIVKATIMGKKSIVMHERTISTSQIRKAASIAILSFLWIILITFCLLISETTIPFTNLFFATISATTNLGADFGVAIQASNIGKLLLTASMFMGKIGTISFIIAIKTGGKKTLPEIKYPHEELLLG